MPPHHLPCPSSFPRDHHPQHGGIFITITTCDPTLQKKKKKKTMAECFISDRVSSSRIGRGFSLSCYIHLPSIMLKQEESFPSHKVWIQNSDQNRSMRVAVKTVHFPIDRVLHLSSKFYLNPLTLVKYSKVQ